MILSLDSEFFIKLHLNCQCQIVEKRKVARNMPLKYRDGQSGQSVDDGPSSTVWLVVILVNKKSEKVSKIKV